MKRIKYLRGESPDNLLVFTRPYTEADIEIAKAESYDGNYTVKDDGTEETTQPTQEERIAELEEALELLLSGATE